MGTAGIVVALIALTKQRPVFRALTGRRIDATRDGYRVVCDSDCIDQAATLGLIIQTCSGEVGFCVDDNVAWITSLADASGV